MSRIKGCFEQLRGQGKKALIPYITAGDPDLETTLALMHALVECGADIIELGVPFSDPSADGPVIQRAVERALARGTRLRDVLDLVERFRAADTDTPVVLMGYLNPIECMGYRAFVDAAAGAGVDGVLVVDMPPEESHGLMDILAPSGLDAIFLVAPTTREERARNICRAASGYVYYVSLKGVTGASNLDVDDVAAHLERLRGYTDLPLGVGFGIKDPESAARIARVADGVVVGSALVDKIARLSPDTAPGRENLVEHIALIRDMRRAMDATTVDS